MNDRIRELAVSAGMSQINRRSDGFYVVSEEVFEQFATELIRECANRLTQNDFSSAKGIMRIAGAKLKEHFGVEE